MARWITIQKKGIEVRFENGQPLEVGQRVGMGLGSIELRNSQKAGLHVVRLSGSGNFTYSLKLNQDGQYRLGPNRGHRVVQLLEETDAILRVLREMDIPVSQLRRMKEGEVLPVSTFSCDIGRAYRSGTTNNHYHTDGKTETVVTSKKDMRYVNQHCGPEVHESGGIIDASYAVEQIWRVHMNSSIGKYVGQISVWPHCDPVTLANVLAPLVFGEGADADYPKALEDFEAARKWVAKKYQIVPHSQMGDRVIVNGKTHFRVDMRYLEEPRTLDRLVRKHGMILIEEHLGELQKFYLRALKNPEEAVRYIFANYRVVAVKQGERQHLRFALLSNPERLGDLDSAYLRGYDEYPLRTLLEEYKSLKDLLFAQASERDE